MDIKSILISIGTAVIFALVSWGLTLLTTWLRTKIKNKKIAELLSSILNIVTNAVKVVYQTYVENIKGTDEWTVDAQKKALQMALEKAKKQLSKDTIKFIEDTYGNLDDYLTNLIEATLYNLKNLLYNKYIKKMRIKI